MDFNIVGKNRKQQKILEIFEQIFVSTAIDILAGCRITYFNTVFLNTNKYPCHHKFDMYTWIESM